MRYHITDIQWDVDFEEDLDNLPSECYIDIEENDDTENDYEPDELDICIGDALSDEYGFTHNGFYYELAE